MANFSINFPDDIFNGLGNKIDIIAPKMIDAALPIYQECIIKNMKNSISTDPEHVKRQRGDLIKSVTIRKAKRTKTDAYIGNIIFKGKDSKGSPNIVKAVALEYGNSKQIAKPFLQKAQLEAEPEVVVAMQDVFNEEVNED